MDQKDLEKQIEREAIKLKLVEERKNPTDDENSINKVLKSANASYEALDKVFDDETEGKMIDDILDKIQSMDLKFEVDEETELDFFCKIMLDTTYEKYEKALKTTKRGKILFMKRRIKERWINN